MSRRGGKRRQVVQLGSSSSNLHRYGYSKCLTSGDNAVSSLKLVGDYSGSESDESGGEDENGDAISATDDLDALIHENNEVPISEAVKDPISEPEITDSGGDKDMPSAMDDELKNFLSEIEAIPMPTDLQQSSSQPESRNSLESTPSPDVAAEEDASEPVEEPVLPEPIKEEEERKKPGMYAMFVKGDTEFADQSEEKNDKQPKKDEKEEELDIPEEPTSKWQMVQDEATQYYYYWNWATNEVTWEIPSDYTQYLLLHKEYEEKMSKFSPEQMEIIKEKRKQKGNAPDVNQAPKKDGKEIRPQVPNGTISKGDEDDHDIRSHAKKKKSHKKHKKRRHKEEELENEQDETTTKSSNETLADKPLSMLSSIVPYLSDDESESPKKCSVSKPEPSDAIAHEDLEMNLSPKQDKEDTDFVEPQDPEKESLNAIPENNNVRSPGGKNDEETTDDETTVYPADDTTISTKSKVPNEQEEELERELKRFAEETGKLMETDNVGDNTPPISKKEEGDEEMVMETQTASVGFEQEVINPPSTQQESSESESAMFVSGSGKLEVEEGEISDTNDAVLKRLEINQSDSTSTVVESRNGSAVIPKKVAENLLNLTGYNTDDNEDEEEEEEGELREDVPHRKIKDEKSNNETEDKFSNSKDRRATDIIKQPINAQSCREFGVKNKTGPSNKVDSSLGINRATPDRNATAVNDDDVDIDFDDVEDIDRVLEMALEKKLEKKKAKEDSGHQVKPTVTSDIGKDPLEFTKRDHDPKGGESTEKIGVDKQGNVSLSSNDTSDLKAKIQAMADLALNKLDFLELGTKCLSTLQVLYVELQTRLKDWAAGGLSTNYMHQQLLVAEGLLEQYEVNAVPHGWVCQWDRTKHRYYYRNTATNDIQLEYPQMEKKSSSKEEKKSGGSERRRRERERSSDVEDGHKQHSSRSSRHRKKDDKDRSKRDRRTSDHHRKKRRRRRTHSSSSESSFESSRHHHKSKRKKKRKSERSPSVEVVGEGKGEYATHVIEDSPPPSSSASAMPLVHVVDENSRDSLNVNAFEEDAVMSENRELVADYLSETDKDQVEGDAEKLGSEIDGMKMDEEDVQEEEEVDEAGEDQTKAEEESSSAVISKPPQIIVPPHIVAMNPPELYSSLPAVTATATTTVLPTSQPTTTQDTSEESAPKADEVDKGGKKKKKEKSGKEKSLSTGSSLMMKKKRVSSMVQKWQRVKKEVEKEDLAKELRQAAIRQQINQLK